MTSGFTLRGLSVAEHKFQAVSTLDEIEAFGLKRPTDLVALTKRDGDKKQLEMKGIREAVQRTFQGPRKKRAEIYSAYIESIECEQQVGGTPAITLWLKEPGEVAADGLVIPYKSVLIAVDGETQTEARFLLAERRPETRSNPIAITLYHGVSEAFGQQILHDYNRYGKSISESQLGAFNSTGPLSTAINQALADAGVDQTLVNRNGPKPTKKHLFSHNQMMHAVVGLAMQSQALTSNGARWFDELNAAASARNLNGPVVSGLATMLKGARESTDARNAHGIVWQCAGVKAKAGNGSIKWSDGLRVYAETRSGGRGGVRIPVAERLSAIYNAL